MKVMRIHNIGSFGKKIASEIERKYCLTNSHSFVDPDPPSAGSRKSRKSEEISCFEVLDILF
jgi:hypothetical protein